MTLSLKACGLELHNIRVSMVESSLSINDFFFFFFTIWLHHVACGFHFPNQGSNSHPLPWKVDSKPLNHQRGP